MPNLHSEVNERMELVVTDALVTDFRPELAGFLREIGMVHLLDEVLVPLLTTTSMRSAIAFEERPWPPAGVGARTLRGVTWAVIGQDGDALLTPGLLGPSNTTNIGLASTLTKLLLEDLRESGVHWVSYFVNSRSQLVADTLAAAGFEARGARILAEGAEFIAHSASPDGVLAALDLGAASVGDVAALALERSTVARLATFHLALSAGISNHWSGRTSLAEVFPGILDWLALPPGGITGTPGPGLDPEVPAVVLGP